MVQIKFLLNSAGIGLTKLQLGINLASVGMLVFRQSPNAPEITYKLVDCLSISGVSNAFVLAMVRSDWIPVDTRRYPWAANIQELSGKTIDMEVSNTYIGTGMVDIHIRLIDADGEVSTLMERMNLKTVWGGCIAGARVRGTLRLQTDREANLCGKPTW